MLILSRRAGESIVIVQNGEVIAEVKYLGASLHNTNQIRLGSQADKSIEIHRSEIWERIQKEGRKKI